MKNQSTPFCLNPWISPEKKPMIIAGPCSAESEAQVIATAHLLAVSGKVDVFRAGIWKPRTRPGGFEGVGSIGLPWLQRVKIETGLPVATEVASARHVEEALTAGIDILWVGARSSVNPFTVQEIAEALRGVDIPVLVKNPVNPDLALWIGALERINNAGITRLAAVHRGFSSFDKTTFRNEPMWDMAIGLKTFAPDMPLICDPSHIAGTRELIPYLAQKALDLDMQGLMIESHIDPSIAWTDAKQQITPQELLSIICNLHIRESEVLNEELKDLFAELRSNIDKIDDILLQKLAERMKIISKIAAHKGEHDITIFQAGRWDEILNNRLAYAKAISLDTDFIRNFFNLIHNESIRKQSEIVSSLATQPHGELTAVTY